MVLSVFVQKKVSSVINRKAFTLIELMIVVALIGVLAATGVPLYKSYITRSRTQEVYVLLPQIARNQSAYHELNREFIEVGPTNIPPSNLAVVADFSGDNWPAINFKSTESVLFGYRGYISGTDYVVEAQGDQDGDGDVSLFSMRITVNAENRSQIGGVIVFDELE